MLKLGESPRCTSYKAYLRASRPSAIHIPTCFTSSHPPLLASETNKITTLSTPSIIQLPTFLLLLLLCPPAQILSNLPHPPFHKKEHLLQLQLLSLHFASQNASQAPSIGSIYCPSPDLSKTKK